MAFDNYYERDTSDFLQGASLDWLLDFKLWITRVQPVAMGNKLM